MNFCWIGNKLGVVSCRLCRLLLLFVVLILVVFNFMIIIETIDETSEKNLSSQAAFKVHANKMHRAKIFYLRL